MEQEKYTIFELPTNNQQVIGKLNKYNGVELEMTYFAESQEFLILISGLRVKAIEVETWKNI